MLFGLLKSRQPDRPENPAISLDQAEAIIAAELKRGDWKRWKVFNPRLEREDGRLVWHATGTMPGYRTGGIAIRIDAQTGEILRFQCAGR